MALNLDDDSLALVARAFRHLLVFPDGTGRDGSLMLDTAGRMAVEDAWSFATEVRAVAAERGVEAALAELPTILRGERVPRRLPAGVVHADGETVVPASVVLDVLVALDLMERLDTLAEAGDPAEELRFLLQAGERRDYAELGEHVSAVARIYAGVAA